MRNFGTKIAAIALLMGITTALQALFNVKKTNQNTVYNCQTGDIRVDIRGDENALYIVRNCIFIAGAATPEKRIDTKGFTKLDVSQIRTVPLTLLTKGIEYMPTESPQKGLTIQLYASIDPVDTLAKDIKNEYKKQGIAYGLQIWRAVKFKSSLLSGTPSTTQTVFTLLQTLPANTQQENDTVTILPNGEIIFDNDNGTITIPVAPVRN